MRFIHLFLAGYFILIAGMVLALWRGGVLGRIDPVWLAIAAVIVIGLGVMAAVTAGRPATTEQRRG